MVGAESVGIKVMLDWVIGVVTSQFVWGIALGVLLSAVSAWFGLKINQKHAQKNVKRLCADVVSNIGEQVSGLTEMREKGKGIDHEFLDLIDVEIGIYGRNREHLVAIEDGVLRRDIRDYLTRVAIYVARVRILLKKYYENCRPGDPNVYPYPDVARQSQAIADRALTEAHSMCGSLRDHVSRNGPSLAAKCDDSSS
tara:strand:+ start:342 stop:932 length:591 start_codon:yes stop_codon:yes gene_type:complete